MNNYIVTKLGTFKYIGSGNWKRLETKEEFLNRIRMEWS